MATLFYLVALSAHFISTSGEEWPTSHRKITPERAEEAVLRWLYNGEIDQQARWFSKRPIHGIPTRRPISLVVRLQIVDKNAWLVSWREKCGLPSTSPNESMPEVESTPGRVSVEDVCREIDRASLVPAANSSTDRQVEMDDVDQSGATVPHGSMEGAENIFATAACEADFDLLNGDTSSPDGNIMLRRLNIPNELFMEDGEILDSDDERVYYILRNT